MTPQPKSENPKTRPTQKLALLEGFRGFAAVYVFLGHIFLSGQGRSSKLALLFQFGQEAVMLFFLLSGFVIYYSVALKKMGYGEYLARRATRIYPLYILALLAASPHQAPNGPPIWSNLLMLQDYSSAKPGVWFPTYGGDTALWSLSYEWWFYMMFYPLHRYVAAEKQQILVTGISWFNLLMYAARPNQISLFLIYFGIWWVGVEMARLFLAGKLPQLEDMRLSLLGLLVPTLFFGCWAAWLHRAKYKLALGDHPILEMRHFLVAFLIVVGACLIRGNALAVVRKFVLPFAIVAPISYSIYIFHIPLVVKANYLARLPNHYFQLVVYTAILVVICVVAEVKLQPVLSRFALRRWSSRNKVAK